MIVIEYLILVLGLGFLFFILIVALELGMELSPILIVWIYGKIDEIIDRKERKKNEESRRN